MLKKTLMAGAVVAALAAPSFAFADDTPPYTVTSNVGIFSQYIFRGLEQTDGGPALQGGADLTTAAGFYLGTWGSNISWLRDNNAYYSAGGSLEWDFYGGYRGSVGDFGYEAGILQYQYIGKHVGAETVNTTEVHVAGTYKWITLSVAYSLFDYFGVANSDGTIYYNATVAVPLADSGLTVNLHAGHTSYAGSGNGAAANYSDFSGGLSYALGSYTLAALYSFAHGPGANFRVADDGSGDGTGRQQGLSQYVVSISRSF